MIVECPYCGRKITIGGLGRKRLDIPLKNICERLQAHRSVAAAAGELNCSEAYIFGVLKKNGLKLRDVLSDKGLATKDNTLLNRGDRWAKQ